MGIVAARRVGHHGNHPRRNIDHPIFGDPGAGIVLRLGAKVIGKAVVRHFDRVPDQARVEEILLVAGVLDHADVGDADGIRRDVDRQFGVDLHRAAYCRVGVAQCILQGDQNLRVREFRRTHADELPPVQFDARIDHVERRNHLRELGDRKAVFRASRGADRQLRVHRGIIAPAETHCHSRAGCCSRCRTLDMVARLPRKYR